MAGEGYVFPSAFHSWLSICLVHLYQFMYTHYPLPGPRWCRWHRTCSRTIPSCSRTSRSRHRGFLNSSLTSRTPVSSSFSCISQIAFAHCVYLHVQRMYFYRFARHFAGLIPFQNGSRTRVALPSSLVALACADRAAGLAGGSKKTALAARRANVHLFFEQRKKETKRANRARAATIGGGMERATIGAVIFLCCFAGTLTNSCVLLLSIECINPTLQCIE